MSRRPKVHFVIATYSLTAPVYRALCGRIPSFGPKRYPVTNFPKSVTCLSCAKLLKTLDLPKE